jgi:ABC-type microcin C transport system permease subunit YejB
LRNFILRRLIYAIPTLIGISIITFAIVRLSPGGAQTFHREAITQRRRYSAMTPTDQVIDAEWRHG